MNKSKKRSTKNPRVTPLNAANCKKIPPKKEHETYLFKMTIFWIASVISGTVVTLVAVLYAKEIINMLSANVLISTVYILCYVGWRIYRVMSREAIVNQQDFSVKLRTDLAFARKFNNIEILKTLISYFLFALPVFYASGMSKAFFGFIGYRSGGFFSDFKDMLFNVIAAIFNLAISYYASYLYEKTKRT